MKLVWLAVVVLVFMCVFIGVHSYIMARMGAVIGEKCTRIEALAKNDEWDKVNNLLRDVEDEWKKYNGWASLTISTEDIEQLEISLKQSQAFAELNDKSVFLGEFIMFSRLIRHIPHREGFHWKEIL